MRSDSTAGQPYLSSLFALPVTQLLVWMTLFLALLEGYRGIIVLSLLVLATCGAAKLWSRLSLRRIRTIVTLDKERAFPGETIRVRARVENSKALPIWLQFSLPALGDLLPPGAREIPMAESGLFGYEAVDWQWELHARRRGCYPLGRPAIGAGDPLGFYQGQLAGPPLGELLVYPRLFPLRPLPVPLREFFGESGIRTFVEDPAYPVGTRDYLPGRPARHIHWHSAAKRGRIEEKTFAPTAGQKILILLDGAGFVQNSAAEALERAIEAAASIAAWLGERGRPIGLATNCCAAGGAWPVVPVGQGPGQLPAVLAMLARLETRIAGGILDLARRGIRLSGDIGGLLIAYEYDSRTAAVGAFLRRAGVPALFVTVAGRERPDDGYGQILKIGDLLATE